MKRIIAGVMLLLPQILHAGTDCRVREFPDHYEAVCIGDEKAGTVPAKSTTTSQPAPIPDPKTVGNFVDGSSSHGEAETQQSELSKRNQAKINAAHMKEVKQQLLLENMR